MLFNIFCLTSHTIIIYTFVHSINRIRCITMFFYEIKKDSLLGEKLNNLYAEIEHAHHAAEQLAKKIGAIAYLQDPNSDFGGISAVEFTAKKKIGDEWEQLPATDELKGKFYVPAVRIRTITVPTSHTAKFKYKDKYVISEKDFGFKEVQVMFSREEAAKMANITLCTQPLERLAKKFGLSMQETFMLTSGIPAHIVLKDKPDEVVAACTGSQREDAEIEKKLSEKKFKVVQEIKGGPKAVKLYRELISLPVIPSGTFDHVLGIENSSQRPGITKGKKAFYCVTEKEINGYTPISEEEWDKRIKKNKRT